MKLLYVLIVLSAGGAIGYIAGRGDCVRPTIIKAACLPTGQWPPLVTGKPSGGNYCTRTHLPAMPDQLEAIE